MTCTLGAGKVSAEETCRPLKGAQAILERSNLRYFIVGEMHGTSETAPLFLDLVCQAASHSTIIVGLEMEEREQPLLDAFLMSDGGVRAQTSLLQGWHWHYTDGRASKAMLELIAHLRQLKAGGAPIRVVAFVPTVADAATQTPYEKAMAANWQRALDNEANARLFVLVGNVHALLDKFADFEPAAMHLPRVMTITFSPADTGGSAFNCQNDGCGIHSLGLGRTSLPRGLAPLPQNARGYRPYGYIYSPGQKFTPSLPAAAARVTKP